MKHKQKTPLYIVTSIGNLDGLVDLSDEAPETYQSAEDALDAAKEVTEEYGLRTYVFKCIPVIMVDRGKMRIVKL